MMSSPSSADGAMEKEGKKLVSLAESKSQRRSSIRSSLYSLAPVSRLLKKMKTAASQRESKQGQGRLLQLQYDFRPFSVLLELERPPLARQ